MASNAGAIRAGKAYVEALLNDDKLRKGLIASELRVKAFGQKLTEIGKKMAVAGTAIATPMIVAAKAWATAGGELSEMSERTGVSASKLSALGYAAQQSGSDLESLEGGLKKMAKALTEASQGGKSQVDALGRLGLTYADLAGKAPDEQFKILADRIDGVQDPTIKAGMAMDLFGKNATALVPLMTGGRAEIERLERKAADLGVVMSDEAAESAHVLEKALNDLGRVTKATYGAMAAAIAPTIKQASAELISMLQSTRAWIKDNQEIVAGALKVSVGMIAVGTAMATVGKAMTTLLPIAKSLIAFLAGPAGWATTAVAALVSLAGGWETVRKAMNDYMDDLKGSQQTAAIDAMTDPVQRAKALMESANKSRMDAIDRQAANPKDRDAIKDVEFFTKEYILARQAYNRAVAQQGQGAGGKKEKPADLDYDAIQARKTLEQKAIDDLNAARIAAIDDEALRENARIQDTYAKKIEEAKKAGASITALEKARDTELQTLARRTENERTKEAAKQAEEKKKKDEETAKEQADKRQELEDEIAKAQIEATMTGKDKELALLEVERRKALADARAAGIPDERVNQLYGLKAAAVGANVKRNEEVVGTFSSGEAAGRMGPSTAAQKAAANGQAQVDTLSRIEQILRRIEDSGGLVVQ